MKKTTLSLCLLLSTAAMAAVPTKLSIHQQGEYGDLMKKAFDQDKDMKTRWTSLMTAAQMAREKSTPDLLKASTHKDWFMRTAAMIALTEYNPEESRKVARKLIKDKALVVRSSAVDVLVKKMDPETRALLWQELQQKYNFKNKYSLWIRPQIVTALAGNPELSETMSFKALLKESNLEIQLSAIQGLEKLTGMKLGTKNSTPAQLVKLWQEKQIN